jgi:flagellar motor switch protein FliN/FliY
MAANTSKGNQAEQNANPGIPQTAKVAEKVNVKSKQVEGASAKFEEFDETIFTGKDISGEKLSLLQDLMLNVYIELGRTQMKVKDILELERGYVIELDKLASEPVEIYANNKKIAEGEVVVIDKHFGIRITNLLDTTSRLEGI